jgi:hypothetical protein
MRNVRLPARLNKENYLRRILAKNNGNVSECAREMKMHRSSFQRFMRKYQLGKPSTDPWFWIIIEVWSDGVNFPCNHDLACLLLP